MLSLTLRNARAGARRLIACFVAISLGVAFLVGSLVMTDTIRGTFHTLLGDFYRGPDVVVRGQANNGDSLDRESVPASVVSQIAGLPGVEGAIGTVLGQAALVDTKGKVISSSGPQFAYGWITDKRFRHFALARGHEPRTDSELVIDAGSARRAKIKLGDRVPLLAQSYDVAAQKLYQVVGTVSFKGNESVGGTTAAVLTTAEAQRVLGRGDSFDEVLLLAKDGVSQQQLLDQVNAVTGKAISRSNGARTTYDNVTGDVRVKRELVEIDKSVAQLSVFFNIFAGIALFVGTFVIYNAFAIVVAQRQRASALLRAIGATPRQVISSQMLETFLVSCLASAFGLLLGIGVATVLRTVLEKTLGTLPPGPITINPQSLVIGFFVGLVITMLSAIGPSVRAGRTAPLAALRANNYDHIRLTKKRVGFGFIVSLLSAGLLVKSSGVNASTVLLIGALLTAVAGLIAAGPLLAKPVTAILGSKAIALLVMAFGGAICLGAIVFAASKGLSPKIFGALGFLVGVMMLHTARAAFGVTGQLARQNAGRNPRRTATTGFALTIGVGVLAMFSVLLASMINTMSGADRRGITAPLLVVDGQTGLNASVVKALGSVPGVEAVNPRYYADGTFDDGSTGSASTTARATASTTSAAQTGGSGGKAGNTVAGAPAHRPSVITLKAFNLAAMAKTINLGTVTGSLADLQLSPAVAVSEKFLKTHSLRVGDTLKLLVEQKPVQLRIAASFSSTDGTGQNGDLFVDVSQFSSITDSATSQFVFLAVKPGAKVASVQKGVEQVLKALPTAAVQTKNEYIKSNLTSAMPLISLVGGLMVLSLIIAAIGIANTIRLSTLERTKEIGLLRALGMEPNKVRAVVRWESVVVSMFGGLVGLFVGAAFGLAMVRNAEYDVTVPWVFIPLAWLGVIAVGMFASWRSSRTASKVDILHALALAS